VRTVGARYSISDSGGTRRVVVTLFLSMFGEYPHPMPSSASVRILICDDHEVMRRGMKTLLESHNGWTVCGEASTGREAIDLAAKQRPDVAIIDITMPNLNGLDAAKRVKKVSPKTQILIFSLHFSDELLREVIDSGARGYLTKSESGEHLIAAVEALGQHRPFFTADAQAAIMKGVVKEKTPSEMKLTTREREILQLLAEGKSNKEIAYALHLSTKTIETHRANIMQKLGAHNVTELVLYAIRHRLVEP
jgi:DNA-binding NarL/FixJ family response regulator